MNNKKKAMIYAILAAAFYAINIPVSKLLMYEAPPMMLAGFLYLGAGLGMGLLLTLKKAGGRLEKERWLERSDMLYTIAMVVLDIAAPIFLMFGIKYTTSATVSLLNNFEIVATSVIAFAIFREKISKRLCLAIAFVMLSGILLGFEGTAGWMINKGALFVLAACICWGMENNCTRNISDKSSEQIVLIKGIFSGIGGICIAILAGEGLPEPLLLLRIMLLGFVSYGLSINFYILAQHTLGAAKTSAFYAVAPFLGVGFSFLLVGERPGLQFYLALLLMAVSTGVMIRDTLGNEKLYEGYTHTHAHHHGKLVHTHAHHHFVYNPMHIHNHSH
ncbi:MAG: DMT family transporter [Eubacteriales bacterium]|nr:DMT family transporter [Eubacteriales bacterium]